MSDYVYREILGYYDEDGNVTGFDVCMSDDDVQYFRIDDTYTIGSVMRVYRRDGWELAPEDDPEAIRLMGQSAYGAPVVAALRAPVVKDVYNVEVDVARRVRCGDTVSVKAESCACSDYFLDRGNAEFLFAWWSDREYLRAMYETEHMQERGKCAQVLMYETTEVYDDDLADWVTEETKVLDRFIYDHDEYEKDTEA